MTAVVKGPQGDYGMIQRMSNYKDVNGIKFPGKLTLEQDSVVVIMDNLEYTINTPIDDSEYKVD